MARLETEIRGKYSDYLVAMRADQLRKRTVINSKRKTEKEKRKTERKMPRLS